MGSETKHPAERTLGEVALLLGGLGVRSVTAKPILLRNGDRVTKLTSVELVLMVPRIPGLSTIHQSGDTLADALMGAIEVAIAMESGRME